MSEYYAVVREGDSLQHFGVLGMRWGVRHDRRVKAAKAMYKTNRKAINKDKSRFKGQKQRKIAASREEWMKERESAANRLYSLNSKGLNQKIARDSSAKTLAKVALMGSKGAALYNSRRGKGRSRLASGAAGMVKGAVDSSGLGLVTDVASNYYYLKNRRARKKQR